MSPNSPQVETQFMGSRKSKMWTYLFVAFLLVVGALVVNVAIMNPELAEDGVEAFLGLPSVAFVGIGAVVGIIFYWFGLKVEADWPELLGAFLIAGSAFAGEVMIGLETFQFGGFVVMPYVFPLIIFLGLMMNAMFKSR